MNKMRAYLTSRWPSIVSPSCSVQMAMLKSSAEPRPENARQLSFVCAGGYGHGANHVFQIPKFTLSGSDVTIREVLDRIALAQGNALWVATIKSADLEGDEPCWRRKGVDGGDLPITSAWRFVPLAEIAELAKEHVAIDVMIAGLLDRRMTTIPVMLDHGLAGDSGGVGWRIFIGRQFVSLRRQH